MAQTLLTMLLVLTRSWLGWCWTQHYTEPIEWITVIIFSHQLHLQVHYCRHLAITQICACSTCNSRFNPPFVVLITFKLLGRLSPRFPSVALGIWLRCSGHSSSSQRSSVALRSDFCTGSFSQKKSSAKPCLHEAHFVHMAKNMFGLDTWVPLKRKLLQKYMASVHICGLQTFAHIVYT